MVAATAQTKLEFTIGDATKNITISGAACSLYDTKRNTPLVNTFSSKSGRCYLATNEPGFYKLRVSHPNYFEFEQPLNGAPPIQIELVPR